MAVKFRKQAVKFLQKANSEDVTKIQNQLNQLLIAIEQQGIIPFTDLDIKKMRGDWEGFYRLRVGKMRVIFIVDFHSSQLEVYTIGARGDVYNPRFAGSKELLNNFKILTGQGTCKLLSYSRACTKTKKRLVVTLNQESIFLLMTNIFFLLDKKINSRANYFYPKSLQSLVK